jgi:eukaryotic-like serine/threonine-protein kinase
MSLSPGSRLGPYEISEPLGAGGMGEVYRATDVNLKRSVAIKTLPAAVADDPERAARFQREAEVLAALNHPSIGQIYGLEKVGATTALVLELVEGPTLADRIAQGPIPVDAAMRIALQIAEALEAAHEKGIVHRDLKPANIKLRPDGTVKVLDFGLAKAMESSGAAPDVTRSPTITTPAMSAVGAILGTPSYMSPEQARGRPVDSRADVWAFGCVFYEMLTGTNLFLGETISDTIARILEREPAWHALPASTPSRIRRLLRQCLQKDQHQRLQKIADARGEIRAAVDAGPSLLPRFASRSAVVGALVVLVLGSGLWWYGARSDTPVRRDPVSVVIADFDNQTNDPAFDRTLEPLLRIVLEGANFISAYDRARVSNTLGVRPPEKLDEAAAREIAVKQGLGVVLSGSLQLAGNGYEIAVRVVQAVTGDVITAAKGTAADKDHVVSEATRLVTVARSALGDTTSDSAQLFAMASLSTTSLSIAQHYAAAQQAMSNNRFEEAEQEALKAVELDPKFGIGWQLLAVASRNVGRMQDAEKYIREALRHLDGMTERERFSTRGMFYRVTGDYPQCVREYTDLIARNASDIVARNQIALCASMLRDLKRSQEEMRLLVELLPNRSLFRDNLALYANYAGDFRTGEQQARKVSQPDRGATIALAFSQLAQGQLPQALETYQGLAKMGAFGASLSASGLGDLAVHQGRFSDAVRLLEQGAAEDLKSNNPDRAAAKFYAIAYARLSQGQNSSAGTAAHKALDNSKEVKTRFIAARVFVETGELADSRSLMAGLASELSAEPRAYAKLIEAAMALKAGDTQRAIQLASDANGLLDTWIGHFDLGRAFLQAGQFAQADSEFDRCVRRRGEALSLFLDEEPTYGYFPVVHYYQGLAREGLNSEGFAGSFRTYLDVRGQSREDPLVEQARRRAAR